MVDYFFHNIQERQIVIKSRPLLFYLYARSLIKVGFCSKMYGTRMLLFSLMRL